MPAGYSVSVDDEAVRSGDLSTLGWQTPLLIEHCH